MTSNTDWKTERELLVKKMACSWLETMCTRWNDDMYTISGYKHRAFVAEFGECLEKIPDCALNNLALKLWNNAERPNNRAPRQLLVECIATAPEGKTGLPFFDDWQPHM